MAREKLQGWIQPVRITRYENGVQTSVPDVVLAEYVLSLYINGSLVVKLTCVPSDMEEMVLGYLYSESLISSLADISSLEVQKDNCRADVTLGTAAGSGVTSITTDSGDFLEIPFQFAEPQKGKRLEALPWDPAVVLQNANRLLEGSELFKMTGNVHSVMLCREDKVLYFSEDIGRYNAFDKTVGKALNNGVDFSETCVYTSGRIPGSIALKAIRSGIPMIVSRSAPSDVTLALAKEYGLTVVGFAKGNRLNIYT